MLNQLANNTHEASNTKEVLTNTGKNCRYCSNSDKRNEINDIVLINDKGSNCNKETVTNIDNNNTILQVNFDNNEIT